MTTFRVVSNVGWLLLDRAFRLAVGFVASVYVARALGPDAYGALGTAQATVTILAFLSLAAIEGVVVRQLVDEPDSAAEIVGSAIVIRALGGLATVLAALLAVFVTGDSATSLLTPLIACSTVFQAFDVLDWWLRIGLVSRLAVVSRCSALLLGASLRVLAASTAAPMRWLAPAIIIESMCIGTAMIVAGRMGGMSLLVCTPTFQRALSIVKQSLPLLFAAIAVALYARMGVLFVARFAGEQQAGLYISATTLVEAFYAIPIAVTASLGPVILKTRQASAVEFEQRIVRLTRRLFFVSLAICAIVSTFADRIMTFVYGANYAGGGEVLSVLIWSIIFVYLSSAAEVWFIGRQLQKYLLHKTGLSALVSIGLNALLVPLYGAMGAVVATLCCFSLSAFASNLLFLKTRPLFLHQLRAMTFIRTPIPSNGT